jgi:hypothetical protein
MAAGDASAQALGAWMRRLHVGDAP